MIPSCPFVLKDNRQHHTAGPDVSNPLTSVKYTHAEPLRSVPPMGERSTIPSLFRRINHSTPLHMPCTPPSLMSMSLSALGRPDAFALESYFL